MAVMNGSIDKTVKIKEMFKKRAFPYYIFSLVFKIYMWIMPV